MPITVLNRADLNADISSKVYTNVTQNIKGNTVRDRLLNVSNSMLNKISDADEDGGYLAVNSGRVNIAKISAETPTGKYLKDNGTWGNPGGGSLPATAAGYLKNDGAGILTWQPIPLFVDNTNYNYGLGQTVLISLTTGYFNNAIGFSSMCNVTTGATNSAFGANTLTSLTTGSDNIAIGFSSLQSLATGNWNIGVGNNTLVNISTGSNNLAFGDSSGGQVDVGIENTFLGHDSYVINKIRGAGYGAISYSIGLGGGSRVSDDNQFVVGGDRPGINDILNTYIGGGVMNVSTDLRGTTIQTTGVNIGESNGSAANSTLRFAAARGTGTGAPGNIVIAGAPSGSSGSTQNALVDYFWFKGNNTIQYQDGNQAYGKLLVSDASGNGTWQAAGFVSSTLGQNYINIGNSFGIATPVALNNLKTRFVYTPTSTGNVDGISGDTTNRITLKSEQQSSYSTPYGDLLRLIPIHGRAKAGMKFLFSGDSAFVIATNAEPYNIVSGNTLTWKVDGGTTQTYTFSTGFTSGAATADEVSNLICTYIGSHGKDAQVIENFLTNTSSLRFSSDTFGSSSTIQVTGGSANTAFGFSTTTATGVDGFDQGDGTFAIPKAWIVCHDKPNDYGSNNKHSHISIELPDSLGNMQTRMGFEYGLDITNITVSSARFIVNEAPVVVSGGSGSNKEYWFGNRNTGQQKTRLALFRVDGSGDQDLKTIVVNDAGVTDTLVINKRVLSTVWMDCGFQNKKGSDVVRQTTLNPLTSTGDSFVVTGTGTTTYMKYDTFQTGAYIRLYVSTGQVFAHNGGSPSAGVSLPYDMRDAVTYTVPTGGAMLTFWDNGTYWKEVDRTEFSNTTGSGMSVYSTSPTLITPSLGVASSTSIALTGTAGGGFVSYLTQSSQPALPASGFVSYANASGNFAWRKQSDTYERSFASTLTGDRVFTWQDASGTVAFTNDFQFGSITILASDQTTTSNVLADVSGASVAVAINTVYEFEGIMHIGNNNTGGTTVAFVCPAGTTFFIALIGNTSGATANSSQGVSSSGTATVAFNTTATTAGRIFFKGTITTTSTAGNFKVQMASGVNTQTSTMFKEGTYFKLRKIQ